MTCIPLSPPLLVESLHLNIPLGWTGCHQSAYITSYVTPFLFAQMVKFWWQCRQSTQTPLSVLKLKQLSVQESWFNTNMVTQAQRKNKADKHKAECRLV